MSLSLSRWELAAIIRRRPPRRHVASACTALAIRFPPCLSDLVSVRGLKLHPRRMNRSVVRPESRRAAGLDTSSRSRSVYASNVASVGASWSHPSDESREELWLLCRFPRIARRRPGGRAVSVPLPRSVVAPRAVLGLTLPAGRGLRRDRNVKDQSRSRLTDIIDHSGVSVHPLIEKYPWGRSRLTKKGGRRMRADPLGMRDGRNSGGHPVATW